MSKKITILNYTEHAFRLDHFEAREDGTAFVDPERAIVVPRGGTPRDSESGEFEPGRLEVDGETLEMMKQHRIAKHWFRKGPDGKPQLTTEDEPERPAKSSKAA